ncbi:unnamed protein product, partial [Soboliphyme baturini]|uniref:SEC7 domain-containing protein n=1 Tax=Soboliphyme baturini TaxID=241478 RepID=A0A183IXU8_9BILA
MVNYEFMKQFNFVGLRVDAALRRFLSHLWLRGETDERERIIANFSRHYREMNPSLFASDDEVHTLACALLLLNTDLHGQNVAKKMSCHDFIENTSQTGIHFSRDLLKTLYFKVYCAWCISVVLNYNRHLVILIECLTHILIVTLMIPDPDSQVEYKKGWVLRKCIVDSDGRKMPLGRRSWRMFYATLKGMIIYLHKVASYHTFRNAIRIHHAFCERAGDYTKKQHVFRLYTATFAEYLFQTRCVKESVMFLYRNLKMIYECAVFCLIRVSPLVLNFQSSSSSSSSIAASPFGSRRQTRQTVL